MIEDLLIRNESKTLEFKANCHSLDKILQTIVAFANTAGGTIIVGIENRNRMIIGLNDALKDEERIASAITDSVVPAIFPSIEIHNYRNKELLVISVSCGSGPFYIKSKGFPKGVYIRIGSTNRIADLDTVHNLERIARRVSFDEYPCSGCSESDVDWDYVQKLFKKRRNKLIDEAKKSELGLIAKNLDSSCPSNAAIILFGKNKNQIFPDAIIRCARFKGTDKVTFIDNQDFRGHLIDSISQAEAFILRHTRLDSKIEQFYREDVPEYPPVIIREAIVNAVLHADYSIIGCAIMVAIFDDRIEITNPGTLPFGMTIEQAKAGASRLRNRVLGRILKELELIEHWGSGIKRIIDICCKEKITPPLFEEMGCIFRITLYSRFKEQVTLPSWEIQLIDYLRRHHTIRSSKAAEIWNISTKGSRNRLQKLVLEGKLIKLAISPSDPKAHYALSF